MKAGGEGRHDEIAAHGPAHLSEVGTQLALERHLRARAPGLRLGRAIDIRRDDARLVIGRDVQIDAFTTLHCGGAGRGPEATRIVIGDRTYIGPGCALFGAGGIILEADVLVSPGVVITSRQHSFASAERPIREQPLQFGSILVRRGAWVGANATILPGVEIGANAVVGAGAIITSNVAPGTVVGGVPARSRPL
jgi:acetyltransferase-like isoleucine patch superfamily enzyme